MTSTHVRVAIVAALVCMAPSVSRRAEAQTIDLKAAEAAITKADEAFCQAVTDRRLDRFLAFVADDATFSGGTPQQLRGRDAVARAWAPYFAEGGPTLVWKPLSAKVLVGGDLGYTLGAYTRHAIGADGKPVTGRGNYLTVWKKQADGSWKVVFDTGSAEPER
jgi:ketosteroid isomerase-like protein